MQEIPLGAVQNRHSEKDRKSYQMVQTAFEESSLSTFEKLEAFPRFVSRRSMTQFLCRSEIYKKIISINGSIIECGVLNGAGLFTWAQLCNIYEPTNYTRKIIGFDTFEGFPSVAEEDSNPFKKPNIGDFKSEPLENIQLSVEKYNCERYLSHIPNIELVKGDFNITGETYLETNKHLLVSLLYLDFDIYEPTKKALDLFLPRMGKGSVIVFDELNCPNFPGETLAILEKLDLHKYRIERFPIHPWLSYAVIE